jgi:hypothetical protein
LVIPRRAGTDAPYLFSEPWIEASGLLDGVYREVRRVCSFHFAFGFNFAPNWFSVRPVHWVSYGFAGESFAPNGNSFVPVQTVQPWPVPG